MRIVFLVAALMASPVLFAAPPQYKVAVFQPQGDTFPSAIGKKGWTAANTSSTSGVVCAPDLTCKPIPIPDGAWDVYASSISRSGQLVAGTAIFPDGSQHPILFDGNKTIDLGALPDPNCPTCIPLTNARSVNDAGQVTGVSFRASGNRAFLWQSGVMVDIGTLGGTESFAMAMNERGHIVGSSRTSSGAQVPFIYKNGKMREIPLAGITDAVALDVNDRGQVLVRGKIDGGDEYYIFEDGASSRVELPPPFNNMPTLTRINNHGVMLGSYMDEAEYRRYFIFNGVDAYDLNDCLSTLDQDKYEIVYTLDLNRNGQIVAVANYKPRNQGIGVLLDPR